MKVDEMHARMSAILLRAANEYIGLKAVGMAGRCLMTIDINDKLKEREEVRRSEGIHTQAYNNNNNNGYF